PATTSTKRSSNSPAHSSAGDACKSHCVRSSKAISRPWHHETAKKVRDWGTVTANFTGTASARRWTSLDDGAGAKWRTTTTASTFDTVAGRVTEVSDRGDDATTDDDRCTRTTYATNTDKNILNLPARVETVATECGSSPDRSKDVISDVRTAYDSTGYGTAPAKGDATAVAKLKKHDGTTATYLESGTTYDSYGRPLKVTDLTANVTVIGDSAPTRTARSDGRTTATVYTPATGFPTKTVVTTPPADAKDSTTAQTDTTEFDPLRGQRVATVDTNGKRTTLKYDALGRSVKVWLPDRGSVPTYQFAYLVEEGQPAAVATYTLNPSAQSQTVSYTLYDGYLRARQTQVPGPDGGRLISDTFYDERGLVAKTFAPYYALKKPERELFKPADALSVESQTWKTYDGLGRESESRDVAGNGEGGKVLATTTTLHGGDRTTVIPPQGGTATTTVTDARGQTTRLLQHRTRAADAPAETTRYAYTPAGLLSAVTDPAGNSWSYSYDQLGNQIQSKDPDKGTTTSTFDDRGQQVSTTDARDVTVATVYDGLGRKTELHDKDRDGPLRATWVYDTVAGAKGQLAESTRYLDGKPYTNKITQYDTLYRPQRTATVIPDSEGKLAGTYQASTSYYGNGLPKARGFSAMGNIVGKGWNYSYTDDTMRLTTVYGTDIRSDATYTLTGQPLRYKIVGSGGKFTQVTNSYEFGTQRLSNSRVDRQDIAGVDQSATYGYDPAGNVTSLSDVSRIGTDTQCFTYDHLRRLTEAWTQAEKTCAPAPAGNMIAGPAPYWHSYAYDAAGNRTKLAQHDPGGDAAKDTKSSYSYPKPGTPQPHALISVDTTEPTGTSKNTYGYDNTGNTTSRLLHGDEQTLHWDAEGHLSNVTEPAGDNGTKTTSYAYDADGNRLITRATDRTILHLGDHTELTLDKGADKPKATRYIPLGSGNQAVLTDDGTYTVTLADRLGTGQLAIKTTDLSLTQRRSLPFGGPRGTQPANWPGTKGYVGGTDDTTDTGLTHLGAREYDPATGRFLSVDPLMNLADAESFNGYTYAGSNPVTDSDPSGLCRRDICGDGYPVAGDPERAGYTGQRKGEHPFGGSSGLGAAGAHYTSSVHISAGRQAAAQYQCGCERPERLVFQEAPQIPYFFPADGAFGKFERGNLREAIHDLWNGPTCHPGDLCENMLYGVMPIVPGEPGGAPKPAPPRIPVAGFSSAEAFAEFGANLRSGLKDLGHGDVTPVMQGSAVTGKSYKTGKAFGPHSDFDVALVSSELLSRAKAAGVALRSRGTRTGPLRTDDLRKLRLGGFSRELSESVGGRDVNFMIYDSLEGATSRAPSIVIR
ncbi:RHS repeat-associated core domain-containing protein, partial [Streptomyces sp. NPDC048506]|uniref:RHS repeat domain-containing protein n=1 Tax=Streptomyces sp. NPDC048506 TaxID=3155028 RepID=UPI003431C49A